MITRGEITWPAVERITQGRLGRTMATCPLCSSLRSTVQKRSAKVLAIDLIEPEFALYFCNHCQASGYCRPDGRLVDLADYRHQCKEAERSTAANRKERTGRALELWNEALPFHGSPAESYLRDARGIDGWLDQFPIARSLRFHPLCPFEDRRLPCMIALVRDIRTDAAAAIHRTALTDSKPPQRISRLSLGPTGGGAIKLSPHDAVHTGLLIGEGIETVLSASRHFQFRPMWSVLDKNGIAKFPVLPGIECLTVAVDNDANGDGQRAAAECTKRQIKVGIECITVTPNLAKDFNDVAARQTR
jgi:hypothetical protein